MERNSFLYKLRRNVQVVLYKIFPNRILSKLYFMLILKKRLNLDKPNTFNEKLQWLKLYYYPNEPLVIQCTDKYAVREVINKMGYGDKLVPLIGNWFDSKNIEWEKLPNRFVLKCNHGCAYNIICLDKSNFNTDEAIKQLNSWLKEDFGAFNIEKHYSKVIPRKIICEEFLGENITDYKFFCFNGEPKYIYVSNDLIHDRKASIGFFYLDGGKMPLSRKDYLDIDSIILPDFFDEMKEMASELCKEFPFVRVDFFLANNTYYFAEFTFTPGACMIPFDPITFDLEWGNLLDINELKDYKKGE